MSQELNRAIQKSFFGAEVREGGELHPDAWASGLIGSQAVLRGNSGRWTESRFTFACDVGRVSVEAWDVRMLSRHKEDLTEPNDLGALREDDQGTIVRLQPAASSLNLGALPLDMTLLASVNSKTSSAMRWSLFVVLFFVAAFAVIPFVVGAPLQFSLLWAGAVVGLVGLLFLIARVATRGMRQEQDDKTQAFAASGLPMALLEQYQLSGDPKQPGVKLFLPALHALRERFPGLRLAASQRGNVVFLWVQGLDIFGPLATMRHKVGLMSGEETSAERVAELRRVVDAFLATGLFRR